MPEKVVWDTVHVSCNWFHITLQSCVILVHQEIHSPATLLDAPVQLLKLFMPEFSIKNMKAWIHHALHRQFRLLAGGLMV